MDHFPGGLQSFLRACLAGLPLLTITVSGWASATLIIAWFLAVCIVVRGPRVELGLSRTGTFWFWLIGGALAAPFISVFLGQAFRGDFAIRDFDSQARLLFAVLVLYVIVRHRIDVLRWLALTVPVGLLITFAVVQLNIGSRWDPSGARLSTFVDPLTFGSLCLTLGLFSALSVDMPRQDSWPVRLVKIAGLFIGVYLSIRSGSRTGWAAAPIVLVLWIIVHAPRFKLPLIIAVATLCSGIYLGSSTVRERTELAYQEITSYRWDEPNAQTSVGDRISFYRIAAFLLQQRPWGGHGDQGFADYVGAPELNRFALRETQEFALKHGFHNEVLTSAVRSGIWGLLAGLAVLGIPAILFLSGLRSVDRETRRIALLGACYWIGTMVTAMTTEVFNLKFAASFHALMLACLAKELIVRLPSKSDR